MLWAVTVDGKRMPLDPRPDPLGNVSFIRKEDVGHPLADAAAACSGFTVPARAMVGQVVVVGAAAKARLDAARVRNRLEPIEWWMSHFATCPESRRAQGRGRR